MENTDNNNIRREKPHRKWLLKPAQLIVLSFLATILIGTLLLALPIANRDGHWLSFVDALFTATSAVCVTGLVVVPTALTFTGFGQAILLLLIQIGGLGLMTLSSLVMVLLGRKLTLKDRLALQEALNRDEMTGVVRLVKVILFTTLMIEGIGALLLMPVFVVNNGGIGVWQAVFTAISAFCNAGFDILGTASNPFGSLTAYTGNVVVTLTVMMLIFLGGIGFAVISDVLRCKFRIGKMQMHTKLVLLISIALVLVGFLFFVIAEQHHSMDTLSGGSKILAALFQSITARTAGFNTVDIAKMHPASRVFMMMLMFVGASPGSTGGGIKTTTLALIVCMMISGLKSKDDIVIMKRNIRPKNAYKAIAVILLGFTLVMSLTGILTITESAALEANVFTVENLMFEAFSAFGTVGLTTGVTPLLTIGGRIAVMIVMFFGRVGPITISLMFISKETELIHYPEGSLMIG